MKRGTAGKQGRPKGLPDGVGKAEYDRIVAQETPNINIIVEKLMAEHATENDDDRFAKEALEAAVTIMRTPAAPRDKLAAARLVLDFTRSKPTTKADVTINSAESFLESVLKAEEE